MPSDGGCRRLLIMYHRSKLPLLLCLLVARTRTWTYPWTTRPPRYTLGLMKVNLRRWRLEPIEFRYSLRRVMRKEVSLSMALVGGAFLILNTDEVNSCVLVRVLRTRFLIWEPVLKDL